MFGKLVGAYVGQKILGRVNRGGTGALAGAATAVATRKGARPLAMLLAAGYGLKLLNDYRVRQRSAG